MASSALERLSRVLEGDPSTGKRMMPCKDPDTHGKPWHCCCAVQALVKVTMRNGSFGIKWSCLSCGGDGSQWIPFSAIAEQERDTLPFRDESLKDRWREQQCRLAEAAIHAVEVEEALTPRQRAYQEFTASAAWRALRNRRLQTDGYICQDCGGSAITAHHIFYPEEWAWEETPLWCLVSLCRKCHQKAHRIFPPSAPWNTKKAYQAANEEEDL